jgi:hypothetical protein
VQQSLPAEKKQPAVTTGSAETSREAECGRPMTISEKAKLDYFSPEDWRAKSA